MTREFQQEQLRQSRASFNLAQKFYWVSLISAATTNAIGLAATIALVFGPFDLAKLTFFFNILPTLTCQKLLKTGAKQLEDASDRLQE